MDRVEMHDDKPFRRFEALTGAGQAWFAECRQRVHDDQPCRWSIDETDKVALGQYGTPQRTRDEARPDPLSDEVAASRELRAALAMLAIAQALVEPQDAVEALQRAVSYWETVGFLPDGEANPTDPLPIFTRDERLRGALAAIDELGSGAGIGFAMLMAIELAEEKADNKRPYGSEVRLPVVFNTHTGEGDFGVLRLVAVAAGPPGFYPDPTLMSFLVTDDGFANSLRKAWHSTRPAMQKHCVKWSVLKGDTPCNRLEQESLGAAFAVGLAELDRHLHRPRIMRLRRLDARRVVSAKLADNGRSLEKVSGWHAKVDIARHKGWGLVAPRASREDLEREAGTTIEAGLQIPVYYADRLDQAIRLMRYRIDKVIAAVLTAVILGLLIPAVGLPLYLRSTAAQEAHRKAAVRETAARVAAKARELGPGDVNGTAMLLAMASDDLAASVGEQTSVFETIARDYETLLKIIRPSTGGYQRLSLSPDGSYALLSTETGTVQLINMSDGQVEWQRDNPPGFELAPDQIHITALAFGPSGVAAVATDDRQITLLRHEDKGWVVSQTVMLPISIRPGRLASNLNTVDLLAFSSDGRELAVYGNSIELFWVAVGQASAQPVRCDVPDGVGNMRAIGGINALVMPQRIIAMDSGSCVQREILTAPEGVVLNDVSGDSNTVSAVGTTGAQLVIMQAGKPQVTIADEGPYRNPRFSNTDERVAVTASTSDSTSGWDVNNTSRNFRFPGAGAAFATEERVLWMHDGVAELHSTTSERFHAVNRLFIPAFAMIVGWTADGLVIASGERPPAILRSAGRSSEEPDYRGLPAPTGANVFRLATDPAGHTAAAIFKKGDSRSLSVWDVTDSSLMELSESDADPNVVTFFGGRLYVGYANGVIRVFRRHGSRWELERKVTLPTSPVSFAPIDGRNEMVAYTIHSRDAPPVLVKLDCKTLRVVTQRAMSRPSFQLGAVAATSDGQIVVAYGTGQVEFMDFALNVRAKIDNLNLSYVRGMYQVPNRNELIISGSFRAVTVDTSAHATLVERRWEQAGDVMAAAATADGRLFATYDFSSEYLTVWSMDPTALRRRVCAAIGRELRVDEWNRYVGKAIAYIDVCKRYQ